MRPIYETPESIAAEERVARMIEASRGVTVIRNKKLHPADFTLLREREIVGIAELKVRKVSKFDHDTLYISAEKIHNCLLYAEFLRVPFTLYVEWVEGLYFIHPKRHPHLDIGWGGTKKRNDWQDSEIVVHYPTEWFKEVKL